MPARSAPPSFRGVLIGAATTILAAAIMAFARAYDHQKLDVARFERDSIANQYERKADRLILKRIDSTTQIILRSHR